MPSWARSIPPSASMSGEGPSTGWAGTSRPRPRRARRRGPAGRAGWQAEAARHERGRAPVDGGDSGGAPAEERKVTARADGIAEATTSPSATASAGSAPPQPRSGRIQSSSARAPAPRAPAPARYSFRCRVPAVRRSCWPRSFPRPGCRDAAVGAHRHGDGQLRIAPHEYLEDVALSNDITGLDACGRGCNGDRVAGGRRRRWRRRHLACARQLSRQCSMTGVFAFVGTVQEPRSISPRFRAHPCPAGPPITGARIITAVPAAHPMDSGAWTTHREVCLVVRRRLRGVVLSLGRCARLDVSCGARAAAWVRTSTASLSRCCSSQPSVSSTCGD